MYVIFNKSTYSLQLYSLIQRQLRHLPEVGKKSTGVSELR